MLKTRTVNATGRNEIVRDDTFLRYIGALIKQHQYLQNVTTIHIYF